MIGIALLFGAILPLDLRLLGLWRGVPADQLARVLIPVAATGLALAATTGALLFSVRATEYAGNPAFLAKLSLAALGAFNAALLRLSRAWRDRRSGVRVAAAAVASILLWTGAILAGRMIAYV